MGKNNIKRLRIFAGPNGSGKTTIKKNFPINIPLGVYVNADDIQNNLLTKQKLNFGDYKIKVNAVEWKKFIEDKSIASIPSEKNKIITSTKVERNILTADKIKSDSYLAADVAAFIRNKLMETEIAFSFETVFSHRSKLEEIMKAKSLGYRIYLYFIGTDSPEINIDRVELRVKKDGHNVDSSILKKRYDRSLNFLFEGVKLTDRAYIFDNSGKYFKLIAEITNGKSVEIMQEQNQIPNWFIKYFYDKSKVKS